MDVAVASDANSEHILSQGRTALGVRDEMVEVEPDFVRTARSGTAPAITPEHLSFLGFSGVSVARIEADSPVLDR